MQEVSPGSVDPQSETRDVTLVFEALQLLRTLHGVNVTDDQLLERSRNAVSALRGEFAIVRVGPLNLGSVLGHLDAASAILVGLEGTV
jgi:hypothetical protein